MRGIARSASLLVLLAMVAAPCSVVTTRAGEADGVVPDVTAHVYPDGNVLLVLSGTDFTALSEIRVFDLSTVTTPEKRDEVIRDFRQGRYDGVFLGAPDGTDKSPGTCDSLSACAHKVNRICKSLGSSGKSASSHNGCSGTCDDGLQVVVTCAE